jgi:hypothetical protein
MATLIVVLATWQKLLSLALGSKEQLERFELGYFIYLFFK